MWMNTKNKYEEAYNCCLTSVTDDLFVPSLFSEDTLALEIQASK